jgi:hypothetical protein
MDRNVVLSFVYHVRGLNGKEFECRSQALTANRSDPKLWLLYGFALKSAGGEDEALSIMNDAYDAYLRAGKPEERREAFLPTCNRQVKGLAGRAWRNEGANYGRNTQEPLSGVENP